MALDTPTDYGTVTGFFDDRASAEQAVTRLEEAGIPSDRIKMVAGDDGNRTTSINKQSGMGFWEALKDFFLPGEDRYTYAEGLRRGGYLVSVRTMPGEYNKAAEILDENAVDIGEREATWRQEGWKGWQDQTDVIPVVEEEIQVGKRDVSHGLVRVRSYVVEEPVQENVNLTEEHVTIERRPGDRRATAADLAMMQNRTIDVEEHGEEVVVAKNARVKELVVGKTVENRTETVNDTVRKTRTEVEDERDGTTLRR